MYRANRAGDEWFLDSGRYCVIGGIESILEEEKKKEEKESGNMGAKEGQEESRKRIVYELFMFVSDK